ncbi:MAG: iron export ABC transporter permease subunit FetB [Acidithiobacillus sp.]|nr:iron export ABC transporter permease subunit FetB [Acidithiobacillus sp.]
MTTAATHLFSHVSPWALAGVLGLLGSAWALSSWQRLGISGELWWSSLRATVQLALMGFLLGWLFRQNSPPLLVFFLILMILAAGFFNRQRGAGIPHAYWIGTTSIFLATSTTLAWMLLSGLASLQGQSLVPIGGMIIGNAMNAVSLALNRLRSEIDQHEDLLLAMLALGASERMAVGQLYRQIVRSSLIPTMDSLKSVGMIHIPGITAGMILAGMPPLEAVSMQLVVMLMLTAAVSISVASSVVLAGPLAVRFGPKETSRP